MIEMRWITRLRTTCTSALLILLPFVVQTPANAQQQAREPELKAAIIANMMLFVEWPKKNTASSDQLTLCILDNSPVATALAQLDGKLLKGKSLKINMVTPDKLGSCHALYLSPTDAAVIPRIQASLHSSAVLLAGDTPGYLQRGIMLNLETVSGRVVFDVDLRAAQSVGLQMSSKALNLARQVID